MAKKHKVTVFPHLCKACGICISLCPVNVFEPAPDGKAVVVNADKCIGCLNCEMHCPDFCVEVEEDKDE